MSEAERLTVDLPVVDVGHIDLLVEQGVFESRAELVRTVVHKYLEEQRTYLQDAVAQRSFSVGVRLLDKVTLEKVAERGPGIEVCVVGMLVIAPDVSPELARRAIRRLDVKGVLHASEAVKQVLADRAG